MSLIPTLEQEAYERGMREAGRMALVEVERLKAHIGQLVNEKCRLQAIVDQQKEALAHWRREADRDAGKIARLERELKIARSLVPSSGRCENGHAVGQRGCTLCEDLV